MPTPIILIFVFALGLIIGSFLNCLIWRLHENEGLMNRSYCPKCRQQINWYDNIPVLSFILLGGKCRHCHKPISWQYPIVELIVGVLFVMAFVQNFEFRIFNFESIFNYLIINNSIKIHLSSEALAKAGNLKIIIQLLRDWFLISVMTVIFIYDLRWYQILDIVTLPACLAVFVMNLLLGSSLSNLLISGIIGGSFFLIQFIISRGKWIGGGDIRLGLLLGLSLGWPGVMLAIIISYFMGSIVGIGLILAGKKKWGSEVPLGVFLAVGGIISLFWQAQILNWYFSMF